MKCDTCWNTRPVISENGFHNVCVLSTKKEKDCLFGVKDYYIKNPMLKVSKNNDSK